MVLVNKFIIDYFFRLMEINYGIKNNENEFI